MLWEIPFQMYCVPTSGEQFSFGVSQLVRSWTCDAFNLVRAFPVGAELSVSGFRCIWEDFTQNQLPYLEASFFDMFVVLTRYLLLIGCHPDQSLFSFKIISYGNPNLQTTFFQMKSITSGSLTCWNAPASIHLVK